MGAGACLPQALTSCGTSTLPSDFMRFLPAACRWGGKGRSQVQRVREGGSGASVAPSAARSSAQPQASCPGCAAGAPARATRLLLQQLLLARDVSAVALGQHVLAQRGDGLRRHHAVADGRLDGHLELLPRDELLEPLHQRLAHLQGGDRVRGGQQQACRGALRRLLLRQAPPGARLAPPAGSRSMRCRGAQWPPAAPPARC